MDDKNRFKIGDDVVLRSGGPTMKVVGFDKNKGVQCEWYDDRQFKQREYWFANSLCVVSDEKSPTSELYQGGS